MATQLKPVADRWAEWRKANSLYSLAVLALADADDDRDLAKSNMIMFLTSEMDEMRKLVGAAIAQAVGSNLSRINRDSLKAASLGRSKPRPVLAHVDGSRLRAVVEEEAARFMDQRLPSGKLLKDCTPAECRDAAVHFSMISIGARQKSKWLDAVATAAEQSGVGRTDTIGSSLSEPTLAKLWEAASAQ